jgi:hypothetical protein
MKVRCNASTDFLVEPLSFTIAYVDPVIAGKRVGENNTLLFSWHWPRDVESIHPIVTPIVDMIILSKVNAAITSLPDPIRKLRELWGCLEECNGEGSLYRSNITPIFDHNTAARWVKAAMKLSNRTLFCVIYRGQLPEGADGSQTPMCGGRTYVPLDDILPPPAEDMIDDVGEESDDDGKTRGPNPRNFPTMKSGFLKFEQKLQKRIIRQQQYVEVI